MGKLGRQPADDVLKIALACGANTEAAARKAGVSARTVYRRMDDPEFQQSLRKIRTEMVQRATAMLTVASMEAVKTLVALQDPEISPTVRLGAARAVLEMGAKLRETVELEERIAALERTDGPDDENPLLSVA